VNASNKKGCKKGKKVMLQRDEGARKIKAGPEKEEGGKRG